MYMKKYAFHLAIILVVGITACTPTQPETIPTIAPTDKPPTTTPSPTPEPTKTKVKPERDAAITAVSNQAQARTTIQEEFVPAEEGMVIFTGGSVQTFENSRASLNLHPDETTIRVGPNSIFSLQTLTETDEATSHIKLDIGQIWILLSKGSLDVETPSGVASVRGSMLGVFYDPVLNTMEASCLEGHCSLENEYGKVELTDGQISIISGEFGPIEAEFMDAAKLQEWVNENPDVWLLFETVPEWLPYPDLNWLKEQGGYFDWVFDEETNPLLEEFNENFDPENLPDLPDNLPDLPDNLPDLPPPPKPPGGGGGGGLW